MRASNSHRFLTPEHYLLSHAYFTPGNVIKQRTTSEYVHSCPGNCATFFIILQGSFASNNILRESIDIFLFNSTGGNLSGHKSVPKLEILNSKTITRALFTEPPFRPPLVDSLKGYLSSV